MKKRPHCRCCCSDLFRFGHDDGRARGSQRHGKILIRAALAEEDFDNLRVSLLCSKV
jgi:hypothetical protein